jgi:hypothetical protein
MAGVQAVHEAIEPRRKPRTAAYRSQRSSTPSAAGPEGAGRVKPDSTSHG